MRMVPFTGATLAVFVPLLLEHFGVLPPAYTFENGVIVVHPVIADFRPINTAVSPRHRHARADRASRGADQPRRRQPRRRRGAKDFAQAWRLRQLLPAAPAK